MNVWESREESLRALGFFSYGDYLKSDLWKQIKRKRLKRSDARECRYCAGKMAELHHGSYSTRTLAGENLNALIPVCRECHEYGSRSKSGNKVFGPKYATERMAKRAARLKVDARRKFRPAAKRRRKRRVVSPEEKQRRKDAKAKRKAARPTRKTRAKEKQVAAIAEGQAILDVIDGRGRVSKERKKKAQKAQAFLKVSGATSQRIRERHEADCRAALKDLAQRRSQPLGGQSPDRLARKARKAARVDLLDRRSVVEVVE